MQIVQISMQENRRYLPVKGWDSVGKALNTYTEGYARDSRATQTVTARDIAKTGGPNAGLAVGLFLLGGISTGNSDLVDRLLTEAKAALKSRPVFIKSYDYDAMGTTFFKTSVEIALLDHKEDMYGIGINAAYVGNTPEQGLADHFGIPRALISATVSIETTRSGTNAFEFDFEQILRKLDPVLQTKWIKGTKVAAAMMDRHVDNPFFVLQSKSGLEVRIKPGRIEHRMRYVRDAKPIDTWSVKGSVFSGELQPDYGSNDPKAKMNPSLLVIVASKEKDSYGNGSPMWQPDIQQRAIDLSKTIACSLR